MSRPCVSIVVTLLLLASCEAASEKIEAGKKVVDLLEAVECAEGNEEVCAAKRRSEHEGCEAGNGHDCTLLGITHQVGRDVPKDEAKAVEYFERACNAGDGSGCWYLGSSHERGRGVEANPTVAAGFYEKGCAAGEPNGCHALGVLYEHGRGVAKDLSEASKHYQRECDLVPKRVDKEGCRPVERLAAKAGG